MYEISIDDIFDNAQIMVSALWPFLGIAVAFSLATSIVRMIVKSLTGAMDRDFYPSTNPAITTEHTYPTYQHTSTDDDDEQETRSTAPADHTCGYCGRPYPMSEYECPRCGGPRG